MRVSDLKWEIRLPEDFRRSVVHREVASRARTTGIRLLLIGLDAADWESIDPLLAAGELPNLKRLIDAGVRGSLRLLQSMISPLLWTTVATGKGPDEHGVADFSVVEAKTGTKVPIGSGYRKVPAVWNILSEFGRSRRWWAGGPASRPTGGRVHGFDRVAALSMLPEREKLRGPPRLHLSGLVPERDPSQALRPRQVSLEEVRRFADVSPPNTRPGWSGSRTPPLRRRARKKSRCAQDPVGLLIKILTAARNYQTVALDLLGRGPFDWRRSISRESTWWDTASSTTARHG